MTITDIYSKRQKRANGEFPDVYQYEEIPNALKTQVYYIIRNIFDIGNSKNKNHARNVNLYYDLYEKVEKKLREEYGMRSLVKGIKGQNELERLDYFLMHCPYIDKCLDVIELLFRYTIDIDNNNHYLGREIIKDAISDLNYRFKEHGVGYRFESNQIIKIDNEIIHKEAIKPALALLHDPVFAGANEEFLKAHEHYRHKRYKECIADCCKAFESTLKIICKINVWDIKPKDGASRLIDKCLNSGLLPSYLGTQFTSIKSVLESGIPTIRNNTSGHGQGSETIEAPEYLAQYELNLTASAIVFLVNAHKNFVPEEVSSL